MTDNNKTPAKTKANPAATAKRTGRKPAPEEVKKSRVDDVCARVANGQTLREIAAEYGVDPGTIIKWVTETEELSQQYARAREAAADLFEADILHRAKNISDPAAARVEIDALKWVAARRAPKKYGDRVNHVSDDGSMTPNPTVIELVVPDVHKRED